MVPAPPQEPLPEWDVCYEAKDDELAGNLCAVRTIACRGDVLITGSSSPVVKVWKVAEGKVDKARKLVFTKDKNLSRGTLDALGCDGAQCIEIADDGNLVAVCYDDGQIGLHDLRSPGPCAELEDSPIHATLKAKFLPENRLVSAGISGSIHFWDLRTHRVLEELGADPDACYPGASSHSKSEDKPDVKRLKKEPFVRRAGADLRGLNGRGRPARVHSLAVSSDGSFLGCGRANGYVSVLSLDGSPDWVGTVVSHHPGAVRGLTFDARSRMLLSGGDDQHLCMFDAARWHGTAKRQEEGTREPPLLERFLVHRSWVTSACFSPVRGDSGSPARHERLALTSSTDGTVKLWELGNAAPVKTYEEHKSHSVLCVAWEPTEGRVFFSAGEDAKIFCYARKDLLEEMKAKDAAEK